jgi:hypothetical protein
LDRLVPLRPVPAAFLLAALTALATLVLAGCATTGPTDGTAGSAAATAPDAATPSTSAAVTYPSAVPTPELAAALDCPRGMAIAVEHQARLAAAGALGPSLLVSAHCESAAGSPPSGVFRVVAVGTTTRVAQILVAAADQLQVQQLSVSGDTVRVVAAGYSRPDVPRCCPDREVTRTWSVRDDTLVAGPSA